MRGFLMALICTGTVSSLLAGALLLLAPRLYKRYSARAMSAVCLIVLMSFMLFVNPFVKPAVTIAVPSTPMPSRVAASVQRGAQGSVPVAPSLAASAAQAPVDAAAPMDVVGVLFFVWAVGAGAATLKYALRHVYFLRMVRRFQKPAPPMVVRQMHEACQEMGIDGKRAPRILCCPVVAGPMLYGFFRPVVLLKRANMPPEELRLILRHELTHFARRDVWRKAAALPALVLHWFNPLVYVLARRQAFYAEVACDERALLARDFETRRSYAHSILATSRGHVYTALSTNFQGGKKEMKKRIEALLYSKSKRVGTLLIALCLMVVMLLSGSLALSEMQPTPTPLTQVQPTSTPATEADFSMAERALRQYTSEYGEFAYWPAAIKGAYTEFLIEEGKPLVNDTLYVCEGDGDLSEVAVLDILTARVGIHDAPLESFLTISAALIEENGARRWVIDLSPALSQEEQVHWQLILASPGGIVLSSTLDAYAISQVYERAQRSQTGIEQLYNELVKQYGDEMWWMAEQRIAYDKALREAGLLSSMGTRMYAMEDSEGDIGVAQANRLATRAVEAILGDTQEGEEIIVDACLFVDSLNPSNREYRVWVFLNTGSVAYYMDTMVMDAANGNVLSNINADYVQQTLQDARKRNVLNEKIARDGMWVTWDVEEIKQYAEMVGVNGNIYADAREGEIAGEQAIAIARETILSQTQGTSTTREEIDGLKASAFIVDETEVEGAQPVWRVFLYTDEMFAEGYLSCWDFYINTVTGEVEHYFTPGGNG